MAMALRPRPSASVISSRYGSHALALGARPGRGTGAESVDTSALVAGFAAPESVDTARKWPDLTARVGGHLRRKWPVLVLIRSDGRGPRTAMPGGLQVAADRLAADAGRLLDAPTATSPIAPAHGFAAVSVVQDVAHAGDRNLRSAPASTSRPVR